MLSEYINSLPKEGKLSREEEARLWDAYKNEGELEARQKLNAVKPLNFGQAARISGVSPADITALMIYIETHKKEEKA